MSQFWLRPLEELDSAQWEALCDRCGRCCMQRLIDDEDQLVFLTRVACHLYRDCDGSCGDYPRRKDIVPGCVQLTQENIGALCDELPATCAYRLRYNKQPLPDWHPLLTGDPHSAASAGMCMAGSTLSETQVDESDWHQFIVGFDHLHKP